MARLAKQFILSVLAISSQSLAGTTDWYQVTQILPPEDGASAEYSNLGADVVVFGDRLATIRAASVLSSVAGYVYRIEGGVWQEEGPLVTQSGMVSASTSTDVSVAAEAELIVAGFSRSTGLGPADAGVAYVFRFDSVTQQWIEDAQLSPDSPQARFGVSVAVQNNIIAVGAEAEMNNDIASGTVYIFEHIAGKWQFLNKIYDPVPSPRDAFGAAVAFAGEQLLVGAPSVDYAPSTTGKVLVFDRNQDDWLHVATLTPSSGSPGDRFGEAIAVHGAFTIIGANYSDTQSKVNSGEGYIFEHLPQIGWVERHQLVPEQLDNDASAGVAVAINDSTAVMGAPDDRVNINGLFREVGSAHLFAREDDAWSLHSQLCTQNMNTSTTAQLGCSVALYDEQIIVGAFYEQRVPGQSGVIRVFRPISIDNDDCNANGVPDACESESDCNSNGVADICDIADGLEDCNKDGIPDVCQITPTGSNRDCNGNGLLDWCELANGYGSDCNWNGILDACDLENEIIEDCNDNGAPDSCEIVDYRIDQGRGSAASWFYTPEYDAIWLNHFIVQENAEWINSVSIVRNLTASQATLVIYDDLENDGDPIGAHLLYSQTIQPNNNATSFQILISPTYVGEAGDSFFVGVLTRGQFTREFHVSLDRSLPRRNKSWTGLSSAANLAQMNPLGGFDLIPLTPLDDRWHESYLVGSWLLRADGTHFDNLPDECSCPANITAQRGADNVVDVADLFQLLSNFGDCGEPCAPFCTGDISGPDALPDCAVDTYDLMALLKSWGTCP